VTDTHSQIVTQIVEAFRIETPLQAANQEREEALFDAATYYASVGWPIFPLVPGEKRPATTNGLHDATTDLAQIGAWWGSNPWYNIGVATGHRFDVIDLDGEPGFIGYAQICEESGLRPQPLATVWTGNAGRHLYVPPTGRGNFAGLRPGLDYRGLGGYVIAPPSRLSPDGRRYYWISPPGEELTA
jgi:hypothetical protein